MYHVVGVVAVQSVLCGSCCCILFDRVCELLLPFLVLLLLQPAASYDVVFSNWLLMYLSDEEVEALAVKALNWVSSAGGAGGSLWCRASCMPQR